MDRWDGKEFTRELRLSPEKSVLEIGVGTGRLAVRYAPLCADFTGIDISPKTVARAKENLAENSNVTLICGDFMTYEFSGKYDIIYSSLTFMHFKNKTAAVGKAAGLLKTGGGFVLSVDKNQDSYIDTGFSRIEVYPDNPDNIRECIRKAGLCLTGECETELAYIFSSVRPPEKQP